MRVTSEDSERLLQAIRVGNIGIFEHDHDAETIYWSPELRQMYGWDAEEPVTLPKILGHVHPQDADRVIAAVRRAHDPQGDGLFDIEHRIVDRWADIRWVLTRSQTHFSGSSGQRRAVRTIGAVQDVTERRKAEERLRVLESQLVHAQKMESIGRLAGGVAHDFNNMLTVISGGIELSLPTLAAEHPSRAYLRDAAEAARSAAALTRQLLVFSRKEAIAPRALNLKDVLRRMERMIVRLLGEDIRLEVACADDLASIWFDPTQIEQIILNLAVNARDAMARGGRLTIEASNVANSCGEAGSASVLLAVSDDGVGMSAEVRAQLFEPFFTTKDAGKGTGLGLAMVYGAVQQNGGRIEVESEPGQGSTFKIYLPVAGVGLIAPAAHAPPSPSRTRSMSILLVEDHPKVATFARRVLEKLGHFVHAFSSGEEALSSLAALRPAPELMITDVMMPGMDGPTFADRARTILPGVGVLFVSGCTHEVILDHGIARDGVDFLAKPYSAEQLALRLLQVLEQRSA
jgi:two-component system, cell cycle sensor histidine kinase and response regulator CckA